MPVRPTSEDSSPVSLRSTFVDRLILAQIARRVNATMRALVDQERRVPSLVNRLALRVQRVLERSAVAGMGGDPYFGPGVEDLISRQYSEYEEEPHTTAEEVDDERFIATTREVIQDIADQGDIVILSRGGGAILRDRTDVLRVGVVGRMDDRAARVAERENISMDEARDFIAHSDTAQHRYFEKAFGTSPIDPFLYHFMFNTSDVTIEYAARGDRNRRRFARRRPVCSDHRKPSFPFHHLESNQST